MINRFPQGDSLMIKSHLISKRFSSSGSNRKNYNDMLSLNLYSPTNQTEQGLNGTRIPSLHELMRSALRVKTGMTEHCRL